MFDKILCLYYRLQSLVYFYLEFIILFPLRLNYMIFRKNKLTKYHDNFEYFLSKINFFDFKPEINTLATLPAGQFNIMQQYKEYEFTESISEAITNAFSHKYKILSDCYFLVNNHDLVNKNSEYYYIDWHKDFKSGYSWDKNLFYSKIVIPSHAGADIKVPREFSRFNHVGLLALGDSIENMNGSKEFILQVTDWIINNKPGYGVNWACTMDVGLRAINWIWGINIFKEKIQDDVYFMLLIKKSLYFHAIHIENNLEYSPISTGNHYLSNIVGLLYISAFIPEVQESDNWLLFSIQELISEINKQVYEDGSTHEGSTHYHRLVTELFLSAALIIEKIPSQRINNLYKIGKKNTLLPKFNKTIKFYEDTNVLPNKFYLKLMKMACFTAGLTKKNNLVPQIGDNDSARVHKIIPIVPEIFSDHRHILATFEILFKVKFNNVKMNMLSILEAKIVTSGINLNFKEIINFHIPKINIFKNAGIISVVKNNAHLIVTCGQNGQNRRGGHNHNDKLSFDLNLFGHDVFVDSGCPVYTANPIKRNYFRGTAAHNTIIVGKREQDIWLDGVNGLFSLRQMTSPQLTMNGDVIKGIHFGYSVPHYREFVLGEKSLLIKDRIRSKQEKIFNLTLDPRVIITKVLQVEDEATCTLLLPGSEVVKIMVSPIETIEVSTVDFGYSYGVFGNTNKISLKLKDFDLITNISWTNH